MEPKRAWTRRDFVRTGSVVGATMVLGSSRARGLGHWVSARTMSALPAVDRLAVRVVVDNAQDALQRSRRVGNVEVERVGMIMEPDLGRQVMSQFGLGYHLESHRGEETRNFLLDFGPTAQSELDNLDLFKIDTAAVDALILSHGHFDHFGGLLPLLARDRAKMRRDLPLYVGGEDTFCYRWFERPNGERKSAGVVSRNALGVAQVRVVMADETAVIGGHAFTTGAIPRNSFEQVLPSTKVEIGVRDGAGCDASHFTSEERAGKIVSDRFPGEHATCFSVKDRGLVVLSSCSHCGIINTIRQAQAVSGVAKVHAVLGGFHLSVAPDDYVARTVQALKEIDPDYVIPMHCTGAVFTWMVRDAMPDKLILSYTGTRFVFGG
jgi:7,8-dihydropterin-6-yl-methyl-4-(beta-D-ribofuranosyl)aminobenzene 5'-phosphate synthase